MKLQNGSQKMMRMPVLFVFFATVIVCLLCPNLASAITYSYDENGNMISDGSHCYEYNDANQLAKIKDCSSSQLVAEYFYDHKGQRAIKKTYENGSLTDTIYYVGKHYETKVTETGTENTSYYYANNERLAKKRQDGQKTFFHGDHLGSASVLTDENGDLVEKTSYYPYGLVKEGGTQSKYLYTGQEKDADTALYYYGARYYSPELRRFAQPDSMIPDPYNPQDLNRYSYVRSCFKSFLTAGQMR